MGKKLTPEEREQRAFETGFGPDSSKVSKEKVFKILENFIHHN
jgi:hypothetical protein